LTNLEQINCDKYVIVANGVKVKINGKKHYNIFSTKVNDILYINTFTINLFYINKLTQQLNYNIIFIKNNIIFQNWETEETIGEGYLENGLYMLKFQGIFCAMTKFKDSNILHRRL
jgi:hypothetical protein